MPPRFSFSTFLRFFGWSKQVLFRLIPNIKSDLSHCLRYWAQISLERVRVWWEAATSSDLWPVVASGVERGLSNEPEAAAARYGRMSDFLSYQLQPGEQRRQLLVTQPSSSVRVWLKTKSLQTQRHLWLTDIGSRKPWQTLPLLKKN